MNDPALSRPMFQQSPSSASAASPPLMPSVGIGGVTTPDQNAQALRSMFSPQAFKRGGEVINGVAHFADGEEVVVPPPPPESGSPVTQRRYSGTSPDPTDRRTYRERYGLPALSQAQRDIGSAIDTAAEAVMPTERPVTQEQKDLGEGRMKALADAVKAQRATMEGVDRARGRVFERTSEAPPEPSYFGASTQEEYDAARRRREEYDRETSRQAGEVLPPPLPDAMSPEEEAAAKLRAATQEALRAQVTGKSFSEEAADSGIMKIGSVPPAPAVGGATLGGGETKPPPKPAGDQELTIESIRSRREASQKQREENKWMGILAAGLGMMASKSRTAAGGIGEGGLQGLQTFAGLEKARREDETQRRHEDYQQQQLALQNKQFGLSEQQLAQQKQIAMAQLEKDPDTVRLYRALGGGDLMKGYQLSSSDATLKSAQLISADPLADEASKTQARAYLNRRIAEASGARGGGEQTPPPGSRIIPLNQLGR